MQGDQVPISHTSNVYYGRSLTQRDEESRAHLVGALEELVERKKNRNKYYRFHHDYGHLTDECFELKKESRLLSEEKAKEIHQE